jgi:hypothetical protein
MSVRTRYLATTLALLTVGLGFAVSQWRDRPAPPRPQARLAALPLRPALPPTAEEVLKRADELRLSPEQVQRLSVLKREWALETERLEEAVRLASAEFEQFAAAAKGGGGTSLQEIQRRSADLRDLSAELRERRDAHSRQVLELLTDSQRTMLSAGSLHSSGGRA